MLVIYDLQSSPGFAGRGSYRLTWGRAQIKSTLSRWDIWQGRALELDFGEDGQRQSTNCLRQRSSGDRAGSKDFRLSFQDRAQLICKDVFIRLRKQFRWNFARFGNQFSANRSSREGLFFSDGWSTRYAYELSRGAKCAGVVGNSR